LIMPPSLKSVGIYAVYLLVVFRAAARLFRVDVMIRLSPSGAAATDDRPQRLRDRRRCRCFVEGRLRPEHHGSDPDVCGAVAKLEHPGAIAGRFRLAMRCISGSAPTPPRSCSTKFGVLPWFGHAQVRVISALIAMALGYPCFRLRDLSSSSPPRDCRDWLLLFQNWIGPVRRSVSTSPFAGIVAPFSSPAASCLTSTSALELGVHRLARDLVPRIPNGFLVRRKGHRTPPKASAWSCSIPKWVPRRYRLFLTAIGGSFYAEFVSYIDPESVMGSFLAADGAAAVLGGIGTLWGRYSARDSDPATELTRSFIGGSGRGVDLIVSAR